MPERLFDAFAPVPTAEWLALISRDLKGKSADKLRRITEDGIPAFPVQRREDLPVGLEGSYPGLSDLRRGQSPLMHVTAGWKVHQDFKLLHAEAIAESLRGTDGFELDAVRLIFPEGPGIVYARLPVDGQNPQAQSFGGPVGPEALATVLQVLPEETAVWLDPGIGSMAAAPMLRQVLRSLGRAPENTRGGIACDPLEQLHWSAGEPGVAEAVFSDSAAGLHYIRQHFPKMKALRVSGAMHHMLGATRTQQIAFALAMAVETADKLSERGFSPAEVFSAMFFEFQVGPDLFAEIAKLRAFRVLLGKVLGQYTLPQPPAHYVDLHVSGSWYVLPTLDAHTNLLRTTTSAMAAVFGGCDSLSLPAWNGWTSVYDPEATRLARNIQLILRHEAYLDKVVDPAGGAYTVETTTEAMVQEAWKIFLGIEKTGGYLAALAAGRIQELTKTAAGNRKMRLASGRNALLGVNRYPSAGEKIATYGKSEIMPHQTEIRSNVQRALNLPENERCAALEPLFGNGSLAHKQGWWDLRVHLRNERPRGYNWVEKPGWAGSEFEMLRQSVALAVQEGKMKQPRALLWSWGPVAMRKARANFAMNLLACGGIESLELVGQEFKDGATKPDLVVLCSANEEYFETIPALLPTLCKKFPGLRFVLAGKPAGWEELKEYGLDGCIYAGMDMLAWLQETLEHLSEEKEAPHEA